MNKYHLDPKSAIPLYRQLEHALIRDIRVGVFQSGTPLPSISELDGSLNVARVTIVNAFKALVKDGFAVAHHGKGYYVTALGEKALTGIIAPLHSAYLQIYANLIEGVTSAAEAHGHRVITRSSDENPALFSHLIHELVTVRGVRWLILVPPLDENGVVFEQSIGDIARLRKHPHLHVAVIDRKLPNIDTFQILQDRQAGYSLLLEHAVARGCHKALFLYETNPWDMDLLNPELRRYPKIRADIRRSKDPASDWQNILTNGYGVVFCSHDTLARRIADHADGQLPFMLCGYNGTVSAFARASGGCWSPGIRTACQWRYSRESSH